MNLPDLILHHWQLYLSGNPEISDQQFDALVAELKDKEPGNDVLRFIGNRGKFKHISPMLSLQKVFSEEALEKWQKAMNSPVWVMPKFDGMALSLHYRKGKLVRAVTRGDGLYGEDVTQHAYQIPEIPKHWLLGDLEVRGEVLLRKDRLKKVGGSNCRNAVAGIMGSKDISRAVDLSFIAYSLLGSKADTYQGCLATLNAGFVTPHCRLFEGKSVFSAAHKYATAADEIFDFDGAVAVVDSLRLQDRLGANDHHPRWAVAYKVESDIKPSVVRRLEWSVGRTGVVTPVAVINPVDLAGAMVERVTLHNAATLHALECGPGSHVLVTRRGGVIPHIEAVTVKQPFTFPSKCECGEPLVLQKRVLVHVSNETFCKQQAVAKVDHWLKVVGINGFGESTLVRLNILSIPALYACENLPSHLNTPLWARTSIPLDKALEGVGVISAEKLTTKFRSWQALAGATKTELMTIDGIGETTADTIQMQMLEAVDVLQALVEAGVTIETVAPPALDTLAGLSFVFTGELESMARTTAQKLVRDRGGEAPSGVTKKTTYLVTNKASTSSKYKKAQELGVQVINEDEFKAMLGEVKADFTKAVDLVTKAKDQS